jgi:membrane-associated phospholipid phosphatase
MTSARSRRGAAVVFALALCSAAPARAQSPAPDAATDAVPSFAQLFTGTLHGFERLPSFGTLEWLAAGGIAAAATHPADAQATRVLAGSGTLDQPLRAGALIGGTPFELGAAFATYGVGRALDNRRVARAGADLIQAQLIAESLTLAVKQTARRARPSGSGFSFPSGHTAVAFASATVLQRHFGWKIGIPAYAVAAYVGTSRIQERHHYLSDVIFGAALGTVAGRTITLGPRHQATIGITPARGGAAVVVAMQR